MRVLIVTYWYIPELNPRSLRWSALAEYWASRGSTIDVLTSCVPGNPNEENIKGVSIYRTGLQKIARLRSGLTGERLAPRQQDRPWWVNWARRIHDQTWKKIYWPDGCCLWYFPARLEVQRLVRMHVYDALITVSHPFTSHLVGLSIPSHNRRMTWIADTGDPFAFLWAAPLNNLILYRGQNYRYEDRILREADHVTVTTSPTQQKYRDSFPQSRDKVSVVNPLLSVPPRLEANASSNGRLKLLYVGTLHKSIRNPSILLRIYSALLQKDLGTKLELHFYGNLHDCGSFFEPYRKYLGKSLFLHGVLPREEVNQAMGSSQVLINIGNRTDFQLPSKLLEYVAAAKPILNIALSDKDSSKHFLKDYPALFTWIGEETPSPDEARLQALARFIENPPRLDPSQVSDFLIEYQIEAIAGKYEALMRPEH